MMLPGTEPDPLDDLAWRVVATPSLDAQPALAVLADALLERGVIHAPAAEPEDLERALASDDIASTTAATPSVTVQAWTWATERASPPPIERMLALIRNLAPGLEQSGGLGLDAAARALFGLERATAIPLGDGLVTAETDEELRERCREAMNFRPSPIRGTTTKKGSNGR